MLIHKALIKYGYSNFSLEIVEYCDPSLTISRKQYYLDLLKPKYNILKVAGSNFGFKHSEATLDKFRSRKLTPVQLEKIIRVSKKKKQPNADTENKSIITENKAKSGIYRWTNNKSGKSYVGSSINLSARFYRYYSLAHIAVQSKHSYISRALVKYGYSSFSLDILEYCDKIVVLIREQYYIDLLNPEYNILTKAGSPKGYKHTPESKAKMRGPRIHSAEHLSKIREHNIKTKGKKVVFTNLETQEILTFISMRDAALKMNISRNTINKHVLSKEPWGKYKISFII